MEEEEEQECMASAAEGSVGQGRAVAARSGLPGGRG